MHDQASEAMSIKRFAVFGRPIEHSLSPYIHQYFANELGILLQYDKEDVGPTDFQKRVQHFFAQGGQGLNITTPHKQAAFDMASIRTARATAAQSANTLWYSSGCLHADNTDGIGFCRDLSHLLDVAGSSVLLVGAGPTARALIPALLASPIARLTLTNRTLPKANALGGVFAGLQVVSMEALAADYDVVINATSSSLQGGELGLPPEVLSAKPFCYDLTYKVSDFLERAREKGCLTANGLGMLVEQAAEAFYVWHGVLPDTRAVRAAMSVGEQR